MSIFQDPDETKPQISTNGLYKFDLNALGNYITVTRVGGAVRAYRVTELLRMMGDTSLPLAVRDMAREALESCGKLKTQEEPELVSDTIITILGIKVRQELGPLRRFVAMVRGEIVRRKSLSDLESEIERIVRSK